MFQRLSCLAMVFVLSACASVHPGKMGSSAAKEAKLPLKISAQHVDDGVNNSFELLELTLENTSSDWLKITKTQVLIGEPNDAKLSVVLGDDLKDWAQAVSNQQKIDKQNKEMLQLGILSVGIVAAAVGGGSGNSGTAAVGAAAVAGSYSWIVADALKASISEAEGPQKIPENHLYRPASIPAKMYLRRWVLLNKLPKAVLKRLAVEFETVEGEKETYVINL